MTRIGRELIRDSLAFHLYDLKTKLRLYGDLVFRVESKDRVRTNKVFLDFYDLSNNCIFRKCIVYLIEPKDELGEADHALYKQQFDRALYERQLDALYEYIDNELESLYKKLDMPSTPCTVSIPYTKENLDLMMAYSIPIHCQEPDAAYRFRNLFESPLIVVGKGVVPTKTIRDGKVLDKDTKLYKVRTLNGFLWYVPINICTTYETDTRVKYDLLLPANSRLLADKAEVTWLYAGTVNSRRAFEHQAGLNYNEEL